VERDAQPGGSTRTLRSNGFVCELGPFAFHREELEAVVGLLPQPPRMVGALPEANQGWEFTGTGLEPIAVEPEPWSLATGAEELPQACRRALGSDLRLGRAVQRLRPAEDGFEVELGGEVASTLRAGEVTLALPIAVAAQLAAGLDPALGAAAARLRMEPRAFAFFGGYQTDFPELTGYGIVPARGLATPFAEVIFCTHVFPHRALPGRVLVRCEVVGAALAGDEDAVLAAAEHELRRWAGCRGRFGFTKLRRFAVEVVDGAWVECRSRLQGITARCTGLRIA
jgi:protoporphyrinogen oxidase